jgi:hypothetical protein
MKYIMFKDMTSGQRLPVTFPDALTHSAMAEAIARARPDDRLLSVLSAGFVVMENGYLITHGRSESLGLSCDPADGAYLSLGDSVSFMDPSAAVHMFQMWLSHANEG